MYNQLLNKIRKGYTVSFFSYKEEDFEVSDFENVIFREGEVHYLADASIEIETNGKKAIRNHIKVDETTLKNKLKDMIENTVYNKDCFELTKFEKHDKTKYIHLDFKKI